jgi:predicted nucleic acid-binding protein
LITIGRLIILEQVFKEIIIPEGVYQELQRKGGQKEIIDQSEWIRIEEVRNEVLVKNLLKTLDRGEAESVVLALELNASYLLMDEKKGRKIAEDYGIVITGLLGVLKRAKSKGFINSVKPILDELINQSGFRIHPKLYQEVLKSVGE